MPLTLNSLFDSPDHYLHSFDAGEAIFVPMDRAAYRRSIFLDNRIQPASSGTMRIPLETLGRHTSGAPGGVGWVFHIAHCGSTLLARALDELGGGLVLREPLALRQAAVARDEHLLRLVLRMLSKGYPSDGLTLVKANVPVNFVIAEIAAALPRAPAILLYHQLEDYLLAILRSDNHRAWLRGVTDELAPLLGGLSELSDGERAAALWLAQLRSFRTGLDAMTDAHALDAEQFFTRPTEVLVSAARLFGIQANAHRVAAVAAGPLFGTYSKNSGVPFDNAARIERREALRSQLAGEVADARRWLAGSAPDLDELLAALESRQLR